MIERMNLNLSSLIIVKLSLQEDWNSRIIKNLLSNLPSQLPFAIKRDIFMLPYKERKSTLIQNKKRKILKAKLKAYTFYVILGLRFM